MPEMTNTELLEAIKIAEANFAHWHKESGKLFASYDSEKSGIYWKKKAYELRDILDKRLKQ